MGVCVPLGMFMNADKSFVGLKTKHVQNQPCIISLCFTHVFLSKLTLTGVYVCGCCFLSLRYGLVRPPNSFDPISVNMHHFNTVATLAQSAYEDVEREGPLATMVSRSKYPQESAVLLCIIYDSSAGVCMQYCSLPMCLSWVPLVSMPFCRCVLIPRVRF